MTKLIDDAAIAGKLESNAFVAIKIESDKEEYIQFAKICKWTSQLRTRNPCFSFNFVDQLVPVPSIFFIKNGIPVKIVTGAIKTVAELEEAINSIDISEVLEQQQQGSSAETFTEALVEANLEKPDDVVCEDDVCYKKPKEPESPAVTSETEAEKQEKIQKAMKLIEQKRIERVQEEKRLEKEREIQRRKEGLTLLEFKAMMEDQEMKQIKEDRLKEKTQAKADRQRVLDQIEQDKKERAARFGNQSSPTEPKPTAPTPASTSPSTAAPNSARIQFKKPDGQSEIVTFDSDMLFADVHLFVKNDILHGSVKEFTIVTAFPRREFSEADFDKTLLHLKLTPASVLLIIPCKKSKSSSGGPPSGVLPTQTDGSLISMLQALVMGLFSPVMALFAYLKTFATRSPAQEENANDAGKRKRNEDILAPNDAAKKRNLQAFDSQPVPGTSQASSSPTGTIPKSGAYKRQTPSSNIYRLHQNSDSEDEEKKTYNGNSTQQL